MKSYNMWLLCLASFMMSVYPVVTCGTTALLLWPGMFRHMERLFLVHHPLVDGAELAFGHAELPLVLPGAKARST